MRSIREQLYFSSNRRILRRFLGLPKEQRQKHQVAGEEVGLRESVVAKRCVVLSSEFFEWDREKQKYYFHLQGKDALYMAGLFTIRNGVPYYCILTTAANESMKEIHHRIPLALRREQVTP